MHLFSTSSLPLEKLSVGLLVAILVCMAPLGTIHQPQAYHLANIQTLSALPRVTYVLPYLVLLATGLLGLRYAGRAPFPQQACLHLLCAGTILAALGGAYYVTNPSDTTQVWARTPMAIAFAGAVGAVASQYLGKSAAMRWQNAWLYLGIVSVLIWAESGDLRLYAVAQVGGLLVCGLWLLAGNRHSDPEQLPLPWMSVWAAYALTHALEAGAGRWELSSAFGALSLLQPIVIAAGLVPILLMLARNPARIPGGST